MSIRSTPNSCSCLRCCSSSTPSFTNLFLSKSPSPNATERNSISMLNNKNHCPTRPQMHYKTFWINTEKNTGTSQVSFSSLATFLERNAANHFLLGYRFQKNSYLLNEIALSAIVCCQGDRSQIAPRGLTRCERYHCSHAALLFSASLSSWTRQARETW